MKNFNFLTNLGNSNQVMTRLRPGNNQVKTTWRFIAILTMLITLGSGNVWGAVNNGDLFERVSSIAANDEVIFVNSGESVAMSTTQNGNNRGVTSITVDKTNHWYVYNSTDNVQVLTVSVNSSMYSFYTLNGSTTGYLQCPSNNNYLRTNATLDNKTKWTYSVSSYVFTILNASQTSRYIAYNSGSNIFSAYSSNQSKPYVFKKVLSAPTGVAASSITSSGATITITDATNVNNYELYYSKSSTPPTAGSSATTTITGGKSKALTGLDASTTYYVWARAFSTSPARKTGWVALTGSTFSTTAGSCTEPHHVDVGTQWGWFKGETLSLSATAYSTSGSGSPIDAGDITGYQWYKGGTAEGNKIAGATSATYTKASCTLDDAGDYYCKVSTGATCSTMSSAFGVKIYALECYTGGTTSYNFTRVGSTQTGTVQIDLAANSSYQFKVRQGSSYYGNKGTITEDENTWEFNGNNDHDGNVTVTTYTAGKFTFTLDYSANGASPILAVTYPARTLYLQLCSDWKAASAKYAIYYWRTAAGWSEDFMTATTCEADILYTSIPSWAQNVMFVRFNPSKGSTGNYDDEWNRTGDLALAYNKDYYHTLSKGGDNKYYGTWGTYTVPTYTISYAKGTVPTGGGSISGSRDSESKTCETAFTLPSSAVFTTTGYTQDGWATEDGGSKDYNLGGSYTTNAAQAFYPHWSETLHNVTVAYKCGETTVKSSTTINNVGIATTGSTTSPDITGYTWSTWSAMPSGVTTSTTPLTTRTITINATADSKTITANYTANVYNITYKDQGNATYSGDKTDGVPTGAPTTHTYGSATALVNGTKTGYTFGGWYTDASCTVSAGSSIGATAKTADFTLYAKWTATSYTLSYDLAGGSVASENPTSYTIESSAITLNNPTKAGYTFAGWTGTGLVSATMTVTIAAGSTGNRSYTATWTAKTDTYKTALHTGASGWTSYASGVTKNGAGYTIPNPGSVAKGGGSGCEDTHYYFAGWVADEYKGSPSGHIIAASGTTDATGATYWAVWEKEAAGSSTVLTEDFAGITTGNNTSTSGSSTEWSILNANFTSETKVYQAGGAVRVGKSGGLTTKQLDLRGQVTVNFDLKGWSASELTVSVKVDNGTSKDVSAPNTCYMDQNEGAFTSKSVTFDAATSTSTVTFSTSSSVRVFLDNISISVATFEDPKAVCEACVATPSISGVSLTGSTFTTTSVPVQATGASAGENCSLAEYGFYWGGSADPSTNETSSNNLSTGTFSATLTGPFTIGTTYHYRAFGTNEADNTGYSSDASFTLQNVSFSMHGHGGDAPATQVVPRGLKATAPSTPSETGYTFDGWWDNSSYTGSAWDFGTNTVGSGNVTLHAKWTEKPKYTITLNAGNGTISDANWTNTSGSTYTRTQANGDEEITLPTPSCNCAGWVFQGWSTTSKDNAASFTPDKEDGASFVPAANVTYYAVYRANATGGTTFNKITSTGDLTTGDYLFVANGGYAMKNVVTSNRMEEVSGFASSEPSLTTENSAIVWTIIKFSSQVVIKNGSNYIGIDANNKICLTTTPHFFTYTYNGTNSRWEFTSAAKTDYQLAYSTAHGGAYAYFCIGTSQSTAIYLYKQGAGLTGNYYTNPTCSDYTINGVADPAAGGTVTLSAASAKTDDKVYALYTLNKDYNFVDWEISGTGSTLSSTTALITEITVGSANTTVTANFELKDWAVTWKANGEALTGGDLGDARNYFDNDETIDVLPPNPTSCESGSGASDQFMGWVAESENWSGPINDVSAKHIYKKASDFPAVTGNVTYHAVWAAIDNESSEWAKVTSVSGLQDGETVAFITYGDSYYLSNAAVTAGTTISLSSVTKTSGNINFVDAMKFTAHYNSTYDGFSFESYSASGAYLWAYDDNKGIYISTTAGSSSGASEIWYLEDFDEGNSRETGYGIGMYSHTNKKYRYLSTQGTTDWRSYVAATVGTGDPVCLLANIYHYTSGHKNYKTKCCEDPELEFGQTRYSLIREDLHGNTSGAYSTIELTYSSESSGTIRVWNQYDEDDNPEHSTKTAWQYTGANTWGTSPTTGGTAATAGTHAYFAITDAENGKATFYVKNATASNGRGTYRVALHQAADATHCETVTYCWIDVTLRDKFVDAVNGNTFPNADAHGPGEPAVTTPAESTRDAAKDDDCHETTRRLVGWVKETDMESWYGAGQDRTRDLDDKKDDAELVAPGATITTSGATWYAVWGIEE